MKDPRSPEDLDRRIDAALRRHFAVPERLDSLAQRSRPRPGLRPGRWIALAAAAAVLLALLFSRTELAPGLKLRPSGGNASGVRPVQAGMDLPFCRLIGPLLDGQPEPGSLHSPDLARLYRDMDACQRESSDVACGEGDFLAERLSASYGQLLELRPEAAGLLHGPFGSDEWPTGTIVTGSSGELTSVLIADRDDTLACCVRMRLPENSGLHLFTWQVGEVVLTEITPLAEPRLLSYFQ